MVTDHPHFAPLHWDPYFSLNTLYRKPRTICYHCLLRKVRPQQNLKALAKLIKNSLNEGTLFSYPGFVHRPYYVFQGPTLQEDRQVRLGYIAPRPFEICGELADPADKFGQPFQVALSYTPLTPKDPAKKHEDYYHCWSLYISRQNDPRLSKTSMLHAPVMPKTLIAQARIHPLALVSPDGVISLNPLICLIPFYPTESTLLFKFLALSIENSGQCVTAFASCAETYEAPLKLQEFVRSNYHDILLAAKEYNNCNGRWTSLSFLELDTKRQVHELHPLATSAKSEGCVCRLCK